MMTSYIPHLLKDLFRARRPRRAGRHGPVFRPSLEALEERAQPSTVTWNGGSTKSSNWSDRSNWRFFSAPVPGDDLVFPAGAAQLANVNDFRDPLFNSLTFSGSGYTVASTSNVLNLGAGGIHNTATSGTNFYNGPIRLDDIRTIDVANSAAFLNLSGVLSGSGGILKSGPGTLSLRGLSANTYTGLTDVRAGLLQLDKGVAFIGDAIAIPGNLQITSSSSSDTIVMLLRSNQIADNAAVTVTQATGFRARLDFNAFSDTIGPLNLTGADVRNLGVLTLNGDVTAQGFLSGDSFVPSVIASGYGLDKLMFGSGSRTFTVNTSPGSTGTDLIVSSWILGGNLILIKEGTGALLLENGAAINRVEVNAGVLDPGLGVSAVILRNDGTLRGTPEIDSVSTEGSGLRTLDDGSPGFTATTGWHTSTGQGFGNDVILADPAVSSGNVETASWSFTGLTPGLYRVFATWTSGPDRSSSAPYSVFDNTTARATAFIKQELAPTGGPVSGGVVFQQLASSVNITSGTLKVQLSNKVAAEPDGAKVIADAVLIERLAGTLSPGPQLDPFTLESMLITHSAALSPGSTFGVHFESTAPMSNHVDQLDVGTFTNAGALLVLSATSFSPPMAGAAYRIITPNIFNGAFSNVPNNGDSIDLISGGQQHTFKINYFAGDGNDVDLVYQNTPPQVSDLELSPDVINEGERVTLRGALTDPDRGDVLSLRVNWGDGAVQTFTDLGTKPFHFTHVYADNSPAGAPYLVRAEWFDQHDAGNFRKLFVTVRNVPPRLLLVGAEVVRAGDVMRSTGRFTDPGADTWRATVDYGDGAGVEPLVVGPGKELVFAHHYTRPGKYRVTVTVFDDDGGLTTDSFLVIVLPPL